jgi:cytosine/adenosine deaminase-related metal-dependent hydrolase
LVHAAEFLGFGGLKLTVTILIHCQPYKVHEVKNDSAEAVSVLVCPSTNVFRQSVQINGTDYVFRVGEA